MSIILTNGTKEDIPELVRLRLAYIDDDFGTVSGEVRMHLEAQLYDFFQRKLETGCIAFIAKDGDRTVSSALLIIEEKPANPSFIHGMTGNVLSVYTEPDYRHRGLCTALMENLIAYAKEHGIDKLNLSATEDGCPIYKKLGFKESSGKYVPMSYVFSKKIQSIN